MMNSVIFKITAVCKCLEVKNAEVQCKDYIAFMQATVKCKKGFKLKGSETVLCFAGKYLSTPTCV